MSDMARSALLTLALSAAALVAYVGFRAVVPGNTPDGAEHAGASVLADTLPEFELEDLAGETRSIQGWEGDALVINFWATWCAPCLREIPLLKEFQDANGSAGVQVVGIAVDHLETVRVFAEDMGFNYPVLVGQLAAMEAAAKFGLEFFVLPFTVFTDHRKRILGVHSGELHTEHLDELLLVLNALEAGSMDIDAARARLNH
ncbi:MAG: TlpA disulfide reductase family protein [Rhodospirillaceae bacterium]|nr:TlpA disulfide reductase family protein [Rhodospirillaceae bacterium]